jgi:hypothetical protein
MSFGNGKADVAHIYDRMREEKIRYDTLRYYTIRQDIRDETTEKKDRIGKDRIRSRCFTNTSDRSQNLTFKERIGLVKT